MTKPLRVRKPVVAGTFYPSDPAKLLSDIRGFLGNVKAQEPAGRPVVLLEPHAGYMYSGQVAAYGFKMIEALDIKTAVVISPSHIDYFPFAAVFDGEAYETPLGEIPVNVEMARRLTKAESRIRLSSRGHVEQGPRGEHALEVQLPFLQTVCKDFTIVPIVMGNQDWDTCQALGESIAPLLGQPDVVVVVSSDLSHFYSYDEAKNKDGLFCDLLVDMDPQRLYDSVQQRSCEACGAGGVVASLIASREAQATSCHVLHSANSGDVTGDRDSVVGYASAVVVMGHSASKDITEAAEETQPLSRDARVFLLDHARGSIERALGMERTPTPAVDDSALLHKSGAFVTLKSQGRLRGCIGMIEPTKPLLEAVAEMARAAAFNDPRFEPLTMADLDTLRLEVSVLSPLRRIERPEEITIGRHGLVIERGGRRGLLLPQVATEQDWDALTFLEYTAEKAGLPRDGWKAKDARIYVFSATVFGEEDEPSQ